jgi:hypothetical protein
MKRTWLSLIKIVRMRRFTCELNEHEEGVAPTDSRLRPDQRLMEEGLWDEANTEKVGHVSLFFLSSNSDRGVSSIADP